MYKRQPHGLIGWSPPGYKKKGARVMERLKMDAPPCWSSALCSHVFPTKPCGHMVSETKVTETGMGNRVREAALRIMDARRSRMGAASSSARGGEELGRRLGAWRQKLGLG